MRTKKEITVIMLFNSRVIERGHADSITSRPVKKNEIACKVDSLEREGGGGRGRGTLRTKGERTWIFLRFVRVVERGHAGRITSRPVLQQRLKASPWKKKNREKFKNAHLDIEQDRGESQKKKERKKHVHLSACAVCVCSCIIYTSFVNRN